MDDQGNAIWMDRPSGAYRARWLFPVDAPPLENGTIEIEAGLIAAVHARNDPSAIDLGNVAIIPGLINAHAHLELSDVREPLTPSTPFTAWLRAVVEHRGRRRFDSESSRAAVRAGLEESLRAGVALVGDIVQEASPGDAPSEGPPRRLCFLELLSLDSKRIDSLVDRARNHLERGRSVARSIGASPPLAGLSPHSPYSVHPRLFTSLVSLAHENDAPVAMHLAESAAELQLLWEGTGEFVTFLESLGVWRPGVIPTGIRPLDYLRPLAELTRALVIHGNYLDSREIDFVAGCNRLTVVYCPRTHARFGHRPHPWRVLLERGAGVALGTDSRASNPDLALWRELLFLRERFPDFPPAKLLELGTVAGARALGWELECGTLTAGKRADLAVVPLPPGDSTDPHRLLFDAKGRPSSAF